MCTQKLRRNMNIPKDCRHSGRFKKDCCEVLWNGTIIEHDNCVATGGCDLIAYDDKRFFIIEIKSGKISSSDATKIVEQIKMCESYYSNYIAHRKKSRIFLYCGGRWRLDSYARIKLDRAKIRMYRCQGCIDLNIL